MTFARTVALLACALAAAAAGAAERVQIPEKYTWNLQDLYPSEAAWGQARDAVAKRIGRLPEHRGKLGASAEALRGALDDVFGTQLEVERVSVYAESVANQDTRQSRPREMKQAAQQLQVDLGSATSWLQPEILALGAEKVRGFLQADPKLAPYRFFLDDTLRWKPHTLSAPEERILADAQDLADAGGSIYGVLKDADLPWPTIKLSTGEEVRLDNAAFTLQRASRVREDRDKVFAAFFGAYKQFEGTMGATLYAHVKSHVFVKKERNFESTLAAALFRGNIPVAVYRQLLADVHESLPTLHRYLRLRQRLMGLDALRYQDLYAPLVAKVDLSFTPDEARALTLDAFAPLGKEYVAALRKGYEERWTDYLPSTGKRPGAYSTGVYGVHPYQLLNFNGKYEDLTTLAHESGHSMHTSLSFQAQPYATSGYPIFVAEVASTFNENLLLHHMLRRAQDDPTRLALLGNYLDGLRTTLFRQTLFAEFELAIHEAAERGETLTGENLSARYLKLVRQYYGHDQGVCRVDDVIAQEWQYIPHFYSEFYVYQYATSLVASTSLARGVLEEAARGGTAKRDAYLRLLRSGGSKYPVDLLREAGVDMTTPAPFRAAMAEMNATMDEMEKILSRGGKG
ncbi:MAG TPA: oligoendopeptidase F [Anaeromyxobacteraceae bacterium]|nr:oligoendopeptidase F [Anaeromyxobacteraceae bacterium]